MSNKIVKFVDTEKLGGELVKAASQAMRKELQDRCVATTKETMDRIIHYEKAVEDAKRTLKFYHDKLKAIENGEFTVDEYNRKPMFTETRFNGPIL